MDKFDKLLRDFDLEFFGSGQHKILLEKALELFRNKQAVIVDVRTNEEARYIRFDFAFNIPVSDIPERLSEIPRDKTVIVFCSSVVRAAVVYTYLRLRSYADVKILTVGLSEMADCLKPGYVLKTVKQSL